jgi:hypothetical protein
MKAWLPVSSSGLRRRTLVTPEWTLAKAGLFPFFDRRGVISRVMVVGVESSQIWLFDPNMAELRIPLFGPIVLQPLPSTLRRLEGLQLAEVKELWHFDPWRVLGDPRFAGSDVAQSLRATNSFGQFPSSVTVLYYRRDLSRVSMMLRRKKQGAEIATFQPGILPERPESTPPPHKLHAATHWRLDPFWHSTNR